MFHVVVKVPRDGRFQLGLDIHEGRTVEEGLTTRVGKQVGLALG